MKNSFEFRLLSHQPFIFFESSEIVRLVPSLKIILYFKLFVQNFQAFETEKATRLERPKNSDLVEGKKVESKRFNS
jgi:hypothetical protein